MVGYRPLRGRYLENGPHTVEVTVMRCEEGRTGRKYVPDRKVVVDRVLIQPSAGNALKAAETRTSQKALIDETSLRIIGTGRRWPGGPHSLVKVLVGPSGYVGETFQQSGVPGVYAGSPMTAHFSVRVDALDTEAT